MREQFQALLAGLLLLIMGFFGYNVLFLTDGELQLVVTEVTGSVVRTDAVGEQEAAIVGMALHPRDELVVGKNSRAALAMGDGTDLSLEAESAMRVVGVEASGIRVELEDGRISARVRPGSPTLSVSNRGREVLASDAAFSVAAGVDGALTVNTQQGGVALTGFEDVVSLQAGEQLAAVPGEPAVVGPIPESLLLDVQWPELVATREDELIVEGRTAPYAEVSLIVREGQPQRIRAGADGRFRAPLQLAEGSNDVQIVARDGMGNHTQSSRAFERSTEPPLLNVEASWGP